MPSHLRSRASSEALAMAIGLTRPAGSAARPRGARPTPDRRRFQRLVVGTLVARMTCDRRFGPRHWRRVAVEAIPRHDLPLAGRRGRRKSKPR